MLLVRLRRAAHGGDDADRGRSSTCASLVRRSPPRSCYDGTDRTRRVPDDITDRTRHVRDEHHRPHAPRPRRHHRPYRLLPRHRCGHHRAVLHGVLRLGQVDPHRQGGRYDRPGGCAYKSKGGARIVATGHTDTSGRTCYNMALSLRRSNAVKDELVRDGVRAEDISVVGLGAGNLALVPTGDGHTRGRRIAASRSSPRHRSAAGRAPIVRR